MTGTKQLGIWMDHSTAHIIEFSTESNETTTINSNFTHEVKETTLRKSENLMHNKEQHQQHEYYKKLGEVIKNYGEVILFGPTDAKEELFNVLKEDRHFEDIRIFVQHSDKLTENQQHAFVRDYYKKRNSPIVI